MRKEKIRRFPRLAEVPGANRAVVLSVVKKINKMYSRKSDFRVLTTLDNSIFSYDRPFIPSSIFPIDLAVTSGRGFPVGIVEIFGPETSGKTAIVEHTLADAQRRGYYAGLFPSEYSLNYKRMMSVGVDSRNLFIFDAETIEDFYDELKLMVTAIRETDRVTPIVIGWDSVASTPTRSEKENKKGLAGSDMGKFAQQMSKFFRRLVRFLFINNVCLLCVNQTRANLGQMYGPKETTAGGKALRFYAWVRCRVRQKEEIEDHNGKRIGYICELKVVKNKADTPLRMCRFPIMFSSGIDRVVANWFYAVDNGIFEQAGTAYKYHGKSMSKKKFPEYYFKHKKEIRRAFLRFAREDTGHRRSQRTMENSKIAA
jgi:recombination protein RecA